MKLIYTIVIIILIVIRLNASDKDYFYDQKQHRLVINKLKTQSQLNVLLNYTKSFRIANNQLTVLRDSIYFYEKTNYKSIDSHFVKVFDKNYLAIKDSFNLKVNNNGLEDLDSNIIKNVGNIFKDTKDSIIITKFTIENRSDQPQILVFNRVKSGEFSSNPAKDILIFQNGKFEQEIAISDSIEIKDRNLYDYGNNFILTINPNETKDIFYVNREMFIFNFTEIVTLNNYLVESKLNALYKSLFIIPLVIFFVILIFAIMLRLRIYWYYLAYLLSIILICFIISDLPFVFLKVKYAILLKDEKCYISLFNILYATLFKFLIEFLETKKYYKKWTIYLNISCYYSLIAGILSLLISYDMDIIILLDLPSFFLFIINLTFIIFASIKIYLKDNKNALFVLVGWVPFIITLFIILPIVKINGIKISAYLLILLPLFFEMLVFLFGIAYQSKKTLKELSNKELEKQLEAKEKEITQKLLLNILPESIAIRLKSGETTIADYFENVSIIFIDIANFTNISSKTDPKELVSMLNDIFTKFDKIAFEFGLEKIKTIGDCYMAVAGLPNLMHNHSIAVAQMAIEVQKSMQNYLSQNGIEVKFRMGLDCGPVVAGVIGERKFIYDLWGDAVNTASRMETTGVVGEIHITERFKNELISNSESNKFEFMDRGEIEIKGKGLMRTFLLNSL